MDHNNSEIARLRQQIEDESAAMEQGLNGYAATAKHTIINQRYRNLESYHEQLVELVGEEEASTIFVAAYNTGVNAANPTDTHPQ